MYITAMLLQAPQAGSLGINIYVHWHPDGLPNREDPWQTLADPGPYDRARKHVELRPGGNRMEAYIDVIIEDDDYTPALIDDATAQMAEIIAAGAPNPINENCGSEGGPFVGVRFAMNNLKADRETMRDHYALLRARLSGWLRESVPQLPNEDERRATSAGGARQPDTSVLAARR